MNLSISIPTASRSDVQGRRSARLLSSVMAAQAISASVHDCGDPVSALTPKHVVDGRLRGHDVLDGATAASTSFSHLINESLAS